MLCSWKCGKPGHLSENCLVNKKKSISIELQKLYAQWVPSFKHLSSSSISSSIYSSKDAEIFDQEKEIPVFLVVSIAT